MVKWILIIVAIIALVVIGIMVANKLMKNGGSEKDGNGDGSGDANGVDTDSVVVDVNLGDGTKTFSDGTTKPLTASEIAVIELAQKQKEYIAGTSD